MPDVNIHRMPGWQAGLSWIGGNWDHGTHANPGCVHQPGLNIGSSEVAGANLQAINAGMILLVPDYR
jgi:hypothetical protein